MAGGFVGCGCALRPQHEGLKGPRRTRQAGGLSLSGAAPRVEASVREAGGAQRVWAVPPARFTASRVLRLTSGLGREAASSKKLVLFYLWFCINRWFWEKTSREHASGERGSFERAGAAERCRVPTRGSCGVIRSRVGLALGLGLLEDSGLAFALS